MYQILLFPPPKKLTQILQVIKNVKMEDRGQYMCQVKINQYISYDANDKDDKSIIFLLFDLLPSYNSSDLLFTFDITPRIPFSLTKQVNTDPMKMQTAFLEVVIPPDIIYEETSGDMMVPEGGTAKLVCKARGFPKPKVVWKRQDGREIIARNGQHGKSKGKYLLRVAKKGQLYQVLTILLQFWLLKARC